MAERKFIYKFEDVQIVSWVVLIIRSIIDQIDLLAVMTWSIVRGYRYHVVDRTKAKFRPNNFVK